MISFLFRPFVGLLLVLCGAPALAQQVADPARVNALARDLDRVQSVRDVKDLQRFYAHFAQFGMWDEMADLFAPDGQVIWGDRTITGREAIAEWLKQRLGGRRGMAPGALHSEYIEDPLVNLSVDGGSAKARWMGLVMSGDRAGGSRIEGGLYENDYVRRDGAWTIATLRYFPQYEGDYANGWANAGGKELPRIPYHFTIDETGVPIPPAAGDAPPTSLGLSELETRIAALNAEDLVRNLQNAYGYYVDRQMWNDVVDLFTKQGVIEIEGVGRFEGPAGVRRAMERMGTQDLQYGELNDHPLFDTLVTVLPGNREAYARSLVLGMTGRTETGEAAWHFQVVRSRMVFDEGLWKVREMRIYPLLSASYAEGWANGGTAHLDDVLPAFARAHPVTGAPITVEGMRLSGQETLAGPLEAAPADAADEAAENPASVQRLLEAERKLARSKAYDGVVNVSAAYGYYLDDFQWVEMASIFAEKGNKHSPFAGFYLGQDRIMAAATAMYGDPPPTRPGISFHWRFQPVIHVSHDGRSANLRTRLFQPRTAMPRKAGDPALTGIYSGALFSGMYPNDQAVLEDGIWRLWSLTIDEPYMTTDSWKGGWSAVKPTPPGEGGGQSPLVERLAPDILMTELGRRAEHFRGGTGTARAWPEILPMWFHYKNPVSGRVPDHYWPDSVPSLLLPESRLIANGYQMPPNGPETDGIHVELTPPDAASMDEGEGK